MMSTEKLDWDRDYDSSEQFGSDILPRGFKRPLTWRAEWLEDPISVFLDIYGLMQDLISPSPGHLQLNGRRGTGKTIFFLNAQHKLGSAASQSKKGERVLAVYINLYSDVDSYIQPLSPIMRVENIYRDILKFILNGSEEEPHSTKRYCLRDYVSSLNWFKRVWANRAIDDLVGYLEGLGEKLVTDMEYEHILAEEHQYALSGEGRVGVAASGLPTAHLGSGFSSGISSSDQQKGRVIGLYSAVPLTVRKKMREILQVLGAKHLIVFIDEFSGLSTPREIQPLLLDRLMRTFHGEQFSIKFATVPGAISLQEQHPISGVIGIQPGTRLSVIDIDERALRHRERTLTGNFEIFLRNLAIAIPAVQQYIEEETIKEGMSRFVSEVFQYESDFEEFMNAGEGMPRQLIENFYHIKGYQRRSKFSKLEVRQAAERSFFTSYKDVKSQSKCVNILASINQVKSRIFKLEREPSHSNSIDQLVDRGLIHACVTPPFLERDLSGYPFEYFYTSYRMEVARKMSIHRARNATEPLELEIEDMMFTAKSKAKELYPKAEPVVFSDRLEPD